MFRSAARGSFSALILLLPSSPAERPYLRTEKLFLACFYVGRFIIDCHKSTRVTCLSAIWIQVITDHRHIFYGISPVLCPVDPSVSFLTFLQHWNVKKICTYKIGHPFNGHIVCRVFLYLRYEFPWNFVACKNFSYPGRKHCGLLLIG